MGISWIAALQAARRFWWIGPIVAALVLFALWRGAETRLKAERASHAATIAKVEKAAAEALAKAIAQNRAIEARYRSQADEADDRYQAALADARSDTDRFIARSRVQPPPCRATRGTAGPAESVGAGVPAPVPAAPELVGVTPDDVRACTSSYAYALEAHRWAMGLRE